MGINVKLLYNETFKILPIWSFQHKVFYFSPMGAIIYEIKNILNLGSDWHCFRWISKHVLDNPNEESEA